MYHCMLVFAGIINRYFDHHFPVAALASKSQMTTLFLFLFFKMAPKSGFEMSFALLLPALLVLGAKHASNLELRS